MSKRYLIPTVIVLLAVMVIPSIAFAKNLNPNKLYGAPSYVLNLVGKKDDWSGGGTYDNPSRHTVFVPQIAQDLQIWMTQGEEFAVLDGSAFDDDSDCNLQLGAGKYAVFIVALGKPGNGADVEGWIYNATDNTYLLLVGTVSVHGHSKTPRWENATDLFFINDSEDPYDLVTDETWIFDYINLLEDYAPDGEYLYLWTLDNNNNKLLQLRFFQLG
jgi:hypothetical protein